jgi:DNA-binding NarL/FixJ family response regulator
MHLESNSLSVLIVHEHPSTGRELSELLGSESDLVVAGGTDSSEVAVELMCRLRPDVLLIDLRLARRVQDARYSANYPHNVRTLVILAAMDKGKIVDAFRLGADGIVLQGASAAALARSIRSARSGSYWLEGECGRVLIEVLREFLSQGNGGTIAEYGLTPRELEIVAKIASGHSNREVGQEFSISERTVKHHLTNIFNKVGVSSRLELALFAMNHRELKAKSAQQAGPS